MCFGKHFQVRVFEQLCLPFIVNFFELHTLFLEAAKIRNVKGEWSMVSMFLGEVLTDFNQSLAIGQLSETDSLFASNI